MEVQVAAMEAQVVAERHRQTALKSPDLGKLPCISEQSIAACLRDRLLANQIYTWAGSNLVAVNPFEEVLPSETTDALLERRLRTAEVSRLPAHVHSIALRAHRGLCAGADQTVVISGESGAGKTFTAHRMLQFLVRLEGAGHCGAAAMERRLNVSSPLLEAFGNARTTNNGNSSRFCKLSRLAYSADGQLRGGALHTFLFEKTRVNWQAKGERNFHIFYQLLAGLPAASLKTLGLERSGELATLSGRPSAVDRADFAVTEAAMAELGLSGKQRAAVFAVLAALLHLGQLTVAPCEQGAVSVLQDARFVCASRLLGVSAPRLAEALAVQQLTAGRRSVVHRPCATAAELLARRDCLVREIYQRLFRWLVDWVNGQISPDGQPPRALSLLDISGFESLSTNSLEQLCINYTNERLQQFFLSSFLRQLEAAFLQEGLLGAQLQYPDNASTVAALDGPVPSVFAALEEASSLRQTVAAADLSAAVQRATCAGRAAGGPHTFTVRHFCGAVSYDAQRLVEKNRDRADPGLLALLGESSVAVVRELPASPQPESAGTARRRHTVLARLQLAVRELLRRLAGSDVQYVRCVRPNGGGHARLVEEAYLRRQLRAAGVVATAQLSAAGFPFRLTPDEFLTRFAALARFTQRHQQQRQQVQEVVERWRLGESEVRVGRVQVFLTQLAWFRLGRLSQLKLRSASSRLQRWWRHRRRLRAVVTIQRCVRSWLERRRLRAAVTIQRRVRGWLERRRRQKAAVTLQRCVRAWLRRQRRHHAAETVQRRVRAWLASARRHRAAERLQRAVRGWLWRRHRQRAADLIQRAYRQHAARRLRRALAAQRQPPEQRASLVELSDADSGVSVSWRSFSSEEARRWSARTAESDWPSLSSLASLGSVAEMSPRSETAEVCTPSEERVSAVSSQKLWASSRAASGAPVRGKSRSAVSPVAVSGGDAVDAARAAVSSGVPPTADVVRRAVPGRAARPRPRPVRCQRPVFVGDGIVSLRRVLDVPVRFHTRRTCLPFSCELPRQLVSAGLADLL